MTGTRMNSALESAMASTAAARTTRPSTSARRRPMRATGTGHGLGTDPAGDRQGIDADGPDEARTEGRHGRSHEPRRGQRGSLCPALAQEWPEGDGADQGTDGRAHEHPPDA